MDSLLQFVPLLRLTKQSRRERERVSGRYGLRDRAQFCGQIFCFYLALSPSRGKE